MDDKKTICVVVAILAVILGIAFLVLGMSSGNTDFHSAGFWYSGFLETVSPFSVGFIVLGALSLLVSGIAAVIAYKE